MFQGHVEVAQSLWLPIHTDEVSSLQVKNDFDIQISMSNRLMIGDDHQLSSIRILIVRSDQRDL